MKHNHSKDRLDAEPRTTEIMGRILGTVLNHTIGTELRSLKDDEAASMQQGRSRKRKAPFDCPSSNVGARISRPVREVREKVIHLDATEIEPSPRQVRHGWGTSEQHNESLIQQQEKRAKKANDKRKEYHEWGKTVTECETAIADCKAEYVSSVDHKLFEKFQNLINLGKRRMNALKPAVRCSKQSITR